jgi:hypothetical protein
MDLWLPSRTYENDEVFGDRRKSVSGSVVAGGVGLCVGCEGEDRSGTSLGIAGGEIAGEDILIEGRN